MNWLNWLKDHVYIAAWCSPIIALVGLIIRNTIRPPSERVNWSMIILYVVGLTCLAAELTPGLDGNQRGAVSFLGGLAVATIVSDAYNYWRR